MLSTVGASTLTHAGVVLQNNGPTDAYAFADWNPNGGYGGTDQFPSSINLAGVNSISVTWNAPAGYMYVVTPPPATNGAFRLLFTLAYGYPGDANSLGSVTESSALFALVYGAAPPSTYGGANINPGPNVVNSLGFSGGATITPSTPSFAFTSFTITAQFSGTTPSGVLNNRNPYFYSTYPFDMIMYGGQYDPSIGYPGAPDPGPLLTLQPVPTPEPSTVALTSAAFLFYFASRKMRSA
jgi:hypothetical protein